MKYYASFPPKNLEKNPFMVLLDRGLRNNGWSDKPFNFKVRNLFRERHYVSILYFHWPESIWRSSSDALSVIKAALFVCKLKLAKRWNYKIVWSVHNVMPHQYRLEKLEIFMRKFLTRNADCLIFHAENASEEFRNRFPEMHIKAITAMHGHYEDLYLPEGKTTRERLGLPGHAKVFLLLAKERGMEAERLFIESWIKTNSLNAHLVISGTLSADLERVIEEKPGITYLKGFQTRGGLGDLMTLSDIVVLPYDRITTSGVFFLAVTFGKPILAPDLPFFRLHMAPGGGILYADKGYISMAIKEALKTQFDREEILALQKKYNWMSSAKIIAEAFNKLTC